MVSINNNNRVIEKKNVKPNNTKNKKLAGSYGSTIKSSLDGIIKFVLGLFSKKKNNNSNRS